MDIARSVLDNLMGRDRNLPKNSSHTRDHYSNSDVCKPYLVCFCFNTLFPNTIYDDGPCNKRHDTYLKNMFDNDLSRSEYERVYIKECIAWIERRLQQVEQKTRKNQSTIDNKTNTSGERPRQILDRIMSIDKDIDEMMKKAAIFGQNGQIDDSSRCLEEVDRLRAQRREIDLMGDNLLAVVKQQKICQICGAIQTIGDTEKRIQMHLEGKIHQGFLRLRTQIDTLKIRLEIIDQKLGKDKEKEKEKKQSQGYTAGVVEEQGQKPKEEENGGSKQRNKERSRERSEQKKKKKQHKHKERRDSRDREHKRHRDENERSRSREKHHKKKEKKRDRSNERENYRNIV